MLQFPHQINLKLLTQQIKKIEILSQALNHIPLTTPQKQHLFHQQLLKSSLFSAKIEGNQLTLITAQQADLSNPKEKNKKELSNILKAREFTKNILQLNKKNIKQIHEIIMRQLNANAGKFRQETSAIYDQLGNAVYITPSPNEAKQMLDIFIAKANQQPDNLSQNITNLAQCHYYFEKIHPFIDGNGRVGRVIFHWQLAKLKLTPKISLPIEEYLEKNRSEYYRLLEKNTRQIDEFVILIIKSITWSLKKLLADIKQLAIQDLDDKTITLLPRRQEILQIITDHPYSSLDFIARRFPTLSRRMISYDFKTLIEKRLIIKHGKTRGVVYSVV